MFAIVWWWPLLLLPAPLAAERLLPADRRHGDALDVPILANTPNADSRAQGVSRRRRLAALWVAWCLLLLGACRPYWLGDPGYRVSNGRDLLLAVDVSGSMQEADMLIDGRPGSRIDVLKNVASQFIERRSGDRIGLILFGSEAHLYVPLTFDSGALLELLNDISTGLAGRLTAIGDAIGVAITTLIERDSQNRVLILVTDGSNTTGSSDPLQAARVARQAGVTIYTIGVGNDEQTMREILNTQNIASGTALNESILRQIALITDGQYFRARDTQTLEQIYRTLDELEPVEFKSRVHRNRQPLTRYPLLAALVVLLSLTLRPQRLSLHREQAG